MLMMSNHISFYLASDIGNSRKNQEDNAILPNGSFLTAELVRSVSDSRQTYEELGSVTYENGFLTAVSDGMGGHAFGELASGQAVKYLSDNYWRIVNGAYPDGRRIADEISSLNRSVVAFSKSDLRLKGMGATLCGVVCTKGALYGFNVGDSRLYRYHDRCLHQLSSDHTEGQRLLKLKLLSEEEYLRFPRKKNLYKFIGINNELAADVFKIEPCASKDLLLICSDGLTDVLPDGEVSLVLGKDASLKEKGSELVKRAVSRNVGRGDNITLILIEF